MGLGGKGIDVLSKMQVGETRIDEELDAIITASDSPVLKRAVVVDVLNNLSARTTEELDELEKTISNADLLLSAPRNAIIVKIISSGQAKRDNMGFICYPFFPPHLCFPIKPGEQVWLITENPDAPPTVGYWMCRIPEANYIDDVNFTHNDRKFAAPSELSTSAKAEQKEGSFEVDPQPGFINGAGTPDGYTLPAEPAYENIVDESKAYKSFMPETVPRFTKRCGDLALQGSNNTLIVLGEDRGWTISEPASDATNSNATKGDDKADVQAAGTIDVVAGRGRFLPPSEKDEPSLTAPRYIENTRGYSEVDKNPVISQAEAGPPERNNTDNPAEGDPDFVNDASRMYVSMKTDGDANFGISAGSGMATGCEAAIDDIAESPYVILKSDEVRVIARKHKKDDPTGSPDINGSLRLVKEGDPSDDLATIVLLPDGTIQISGSKIFIGRSPDDGGVGADDGAPGPGDMQPYVKYQQLEELLTEAFENIKSFAQSLQTNFNANVTPGYGAPNPTLIASAGAECTTLQTDMDSRINDIPTVKSERIFGE